VACPLLWRAQSHLHDCLKYCYSLRPQEFVLVVHAGPRCTLGVERVIVVDSIHIAGATLCIVYYRIAVEPHVICWLLMFSLSLAMLVAISYDRISSINKTVTIKICVPCVFLSSCHAIETSCSHTAGRSSSHAPKTCRANHMPPY
jgi:hypothetical protein